MRNKEVFMHVDDFGDLYLYDVLLSFIYPRVFVCVDVFDCRYLFYEMSSDGGKDIWLVSKITKGEYFDLIDRNMPIQRVYEKKKVGRSFRYPKRIQKQMSSKCMLMEKSGLKCCPQRTSMLTVS